jgi:hypothetical protein
MLDHPPPRDRLPTIPYDLSEYAREQTGPSSWSAQSDAPPLHDDPLRGLASGQLLDVSPSDIPSVAPMHMEEEARRIDHREAFVLSLIDGQSTVGDILERVGSPDAEALGVLCDLCARGVITLDRPGCHLG